MLIGYARVSTLDQNLDLQLDALNQAGCKRIFTDKLSSSKSERPGLQKTIECGRNGDTVVVWKLDRLGRSLTELIKIINDLKDNGVGLKSLHENIDTASEVGKLIFHIFASLAEFEKGIIKQRTMAGLAAARARGRLGGRPKKLNESKITQAKAMHADKTISIKHICETLNIAKTTLYSYLELGKLNDKT